MPWCSLRRLSRRASGLSLVLMLVGLASGCLPELESQCSVNGDCPAERPVCVASVCTPLLDGRDGLPPDGTAPGGDAGGDAAADTGPDGDAAADTGSVDRGPDRGVPDGGADACVASGAEVCNGRDDDCNGQIDEGFRLGEACTLGVGGCEVFGERACRDDRAVCDGVTGEPIDEICDGEDNDCDGEIDENPAGDGPLTRSCYEHGDVFAGVGNCDVGTRVCDTGFWGPCVGDQPPFDELCNQLDDDCNGEVDDVESGDCSCTVGQNQYCYGAPEGTVDVGICTAGSQRCVELDAGGTGFGPCDGQQLPEDEVCNGFDDDCDGDTDEGGFGACSAGVGPCREVGVNRCVDAALVCGAEAGQPGVEVCNGVDDDCDGEEDELPGTICGDPQNASAECVAALCMQRCDVGFLDRDGDPDNGCERGCGGRVGGSILDTDGTSLDVAARPDADEFALVWIDSGGNPWMSIDGDPAFAIGGPDAVRGEDIQVVGVRNGYAVMVASRDGSWVVDVRPGGQGPTVDVFGGAAGVEGLFMIYRDPDPDGAEDEVPGLRLGGGGNALDVALERLPRTFGADFGPGADFAEAGVGWLPRSLSATVVGDSAILAGAAAAQREATDIRVLVLGRDNRLDFTVAAPPNGRARTVVGARGTSIVLGISGDQGSAAFGFDAADDAMGVPVDIAGTGVVRGVQFGPSGPVINGVANNDLVSVGLEFGPVGLGPVFGPTPVVSNGQPGGGQLSIAASTLTTTDRRIIAWRDMRSRVRYAINPCR